MDTNLEPTPAPLRVGRPPLYPGGKGCRMTIVLPETLAGSLDAYMLTSSVKSKSVVIEQALQQYLGGSTSEAEVQLRIRAETAEDGARGWREHARRLEAKIERWRLEGRVPKLGRPRLGAPSSTPPPEEPLEDPLGVLDDLGVL